MTYFCRDSFFGLQKHILIVFAAVIFAALLFLAVKQERRTVIHNKPCCLKGYICQAAMNSGR